MPVLIWMRRNAGCADAFGIVAGLLVALDHGDRQLAPSSSSIVATSSVVLPEPGLETRFSARMPPASKQAAVGGGIGIVLRQDVLLDLHHAGLAETGRMGARRAGAEIDHRGAVAVMVMLVSVDDRDR